MSATPGCSNCILTNNLLTPACRTRPLPLSQAVASSVARSSGRARAVRVRAQTEYDRDTGFVAEDNSGRSNIFPRKQQAYIKSSTSDAAARQGLGGAQGKGMTVN